MRILVVTPRFPLPTIKGDKLRSWQMIRTLAAAHEVTLLSYVGSKEELRLIGEVEEICRVETVPFNTAFRGFELLKSIGGSKPYQVHLYDSPQMRRRVENLIAGSDIVHLSTLRVAGNLPLHLGPKLVVDFTDAFSLNFKRRAESSGFLLRGLLREELRRLVSFESDLVERSDLAMAVGSVDALALGEKVKVVPNSVDLETFHPPGKDFPRNDIIFTGNLNYTPNVAAAIYMATEILPLVLRECPSAKLRLVGANPSQKVRALASRNVIVTGYVPSIADELRKARVAVAPLVGGAGLQNKILEAMACATPVVSTSIANAGIMARADKEILVADDPENFAASVVVLLKDGDKAAEIGHNGRAFVMENFSRDRIGRMVLDLYSRLDASTDTPPGVPPKGGTA